jgi:hypothetical protein
MRLHTVVLAQLLGEGADMLAADPIIPPANRAAYRDTIVSVFSALFSGKFAGEELRLYVPKTPGDLRIARDERIAAALAAGKPATDVARTERVSERHVRRVRGRIGGFGV